MSDGLLGVGLFYIVNALFKVVFLQRGSLFYNSVPRGQPPFSVLSKIEMHGEAGEARPHVRL